MPSFKRQRHDGRGAESAEGGGVWGLGVPLPILGGLGERRELPSEVWGEAPADFDLVHFVIKIWHLMATILINFQFLINQHIV